MNRQEKIDAIYDKIADKTLSFGCKFGVKKEISWGHITFEEGFIFTLIKSRKIEKILYANEKFGGPLHFTDFEFKDLEVIGHPVMIGDVLDWIENNINNGFKKCVDCGADMIYEEETKECYCSNENCEDEMVPEDLVFLNKWELVIENDWKDGRFINDFLWKNLRAPIEDQSDECVDFIYDLIFK